MKKAVSKEKITIMNPRGTPPPVKLIPMAPRLDTLDGKTIYIVDVNFPNTENFYKAAIKFFTKHFPKTKWVVVNKGGSFFNEGQTLWQEIKKKGDAAIVGPGHMDTLGPAVVGWCTELEAIGVPAVPLICKVFPEMERKVAFERGMPDIRMTFIPYEVINTPVATSYGLLEGKDPVTGKPVLDEIVDTLTRQPTAAEKKTGIIKRPVPRFLEPDTPDNLQRTLLEKGWTDYYPVVLPTKEKVAAMLKGTSHKADEYVGSMFPASPHEAWQYNVEQVAVNAVMAGARPEHFPVILAIAATGQTSLWTSVTSQTRMVVVNGPMRNEINMNSGLGAMGPFNEANAVIGRSWTFISKNLGGGGGVPRLTYHGAFGNGQNYNNLCFAENEEGLPKGWKPFHAMHGFKRNESTVSIFAGFGVIQGIGAQGGPPEPAIKKQLMQLYSSAQKHFYRGQAFPFRTVLLVTPMAANLLAEEGYKSKEEFYQWLKNSIIKPAGKGETKEPDPQIKIIVVGATTQASMFCSLWYNATASIDKWR